MQAGASTCLPDLAEDLGRVKHAGHDIVLRLPCGSLEVHHIKLEVTAQLWVCELQGTKTYTITWSVTGTRLAAGCLAG